MIKNFVKYELKEHIENSTINSIERRNYIILRYPCANDSICTPYKLTLHPGSYKIECWGSKGLTWVNLSQPGFGAYTKGTILLTKRITLYVYVGTIGAYNSIRDTYYRQGGRFGGGATDIRLNTSDEWFDKRSLMSRIMVAAGGGGAEWEASIGGNGGDLVGGSSTSAKYNTGTAQHEEKCKGANQTSSSSCPNYLINNIIRYSFAGEFGSAGIVTGITDFGGMGGGGYYGGTSYQYSCAGSGGSSFISGHKGCDAIKDNETIQHTGAPYHYSGLSFYDTLMIPGNETMPLPSGRTGIYDDAIGGAFRITIMNYFAFSCRQKRSSSSMLFVYLMVTHLK